MKGNNSDERGIRLHPDSTDFILKFDTVDPEFQRGFECGEIWACLSDDVLEIHSIVSADNAEMIIRMAEATNYSFDARYLTELECEAINIGPGEWMTVILKNNSV